MDDIRILQHFISQRPKSDLAEIEAAIGPGPASRLMRQLAGRELYLPSARTVFLTSLPLIVKEHTAALTGKDKKAAMKELSKVYGLPTWKIRKYANIG